MFKYLQIVQLNHDEKEHNLKKGEIGTVVEIYKGGKAFEVEFLNKSGETRALLTLMPEEINAIVSLEKVTIDALDINTHSTAQSYFLSANTVLKGVRHIFDIIESTIGVESEDNIRDFNYSIITL